MSRRTEVFEVVVRGFVILQAREDDSDVVYGYFLTGPKNGGVESSAVVSIKAAVKLEYRRSEQLSSLTLTRTLVRSEKKLACLTFTSLA